VEHDEKEKDCNREASKAVLPASLTILDDQIEEPLGEVAEQSGSGEVSLGAILELARFGPGDTGQMVAETALSEADAEGMPPVSITSTCTGDEVLSGGLIDKSAVGDMEAADYQDAAAIIGSAVNAASPNADEDEREPSGKVVDRTEEKDVSFTAMDMSLFGPDMTSGSVEQDVTANEPSTTDVKEMLLKTLFADSRADGEEEKASNQIAMVMGHAEDVINPVVKPVETTVHNARESNVLRSRSATPLPDGGQAVVRTATLVEGDDKEVMFTALDLPLFGPDVTSTSVENEDAASESSHADRNMMLCEQLFVNSCQEDMQYDAFKQIGVVEECIVNPVDEHIEPVVDGVTVSRLLRSPSATSLPTAGQGAKRKATAVEADDEAEQTALPPTKKVRSTARKGAEQESTRWRLTTR
jgi:Asp-tRNA(Asn)/Glu-tRNA(Gln) amidotransferase C subunit